MDADLIKVSLQRGVSQTVNEIFSVNDDSIQRGMVGVGITGLADVYFQGISMSDVSVPKQKDTFNYDKVLDNLNSTHVEN